MVHYFSGSGLIYNFDHLDYLYSLDKCNILFTFAEPIKKLNQMLDYKREHPEMSLFLDSGAFSAYTKGKDIDIDEYINFINTNDSLLDIIANLDVIPSGDNVEECAKESYENFIYIRERVKSPHKIMFVYHYGESTNYLEKVLKLDDEYGKCLLIGVGGLAVLNPVQAKKRVEVINKCYSTIKKCGREDVHTHLFGMTIKSVLKECGATSSDSAGALQASNYFEFAVRLGDNWSVFSMLPKSGRPRYHTLDIITQNKVRKFVEDNGFDFDILLKKEATKDFIYYNLFCYSYMFDDVGEPDYSKLGRKQSLW